MREVEGQKKRGRDWSLGARLGFGGAGREPPGGEEGEEEGVRGLEREIAEFEERVGGLEVMRKVAARMKRECETELANAVSGLMVLVLIVRLSDNFEGCALFHELTLFPLVAALLSYEPGYASGISISLYSRADCSH